MTPVTAGHAALSGSSVSTPSGSTLSSSSSGGRDRKPEGYQDASGGALPQPVACHPTPTALLPLILPAESPHPAPRKQIIIGRPGTGKAGGGRGGQTTPVGLTFCFCQRQKSAEPRLVFLRSSQFLYLSGFTAVSSDCFGYDSWIVYSCLYHNILENPFLSLSFQLRGNIIHSSRLQTAVLEMLKGENIPVLSGALAVNSGERKVFTFTPF